MKSQDDLLKEQAVIQSRIDKFQAIIDKNLAQGEFKIDNIAGELQWLRKELIRISAQLPSDSSTNNSDLERKAISIAGGGVTIRAKNDDTTKYEFKKRKTYDDLLKEAKECESEGAKQASGSRKKG